jgi:hypothetical protein
MWEFDTGFRASAKCGIVKGWMLLIVIRCIFLLSAFYIVLFQLFRGRY